MSEIESPLGREKYISLETFRKNGTSVQTPVWVAGDGARLYVFSEGSSWKVKRLRNDPRFRAAPCSARGTVRGEWWQGKGRVLEDAGDIERALAALRKKYGWMMRIGDFFAKIAGRFDKRAYLELTVEGKAGA